VLESFTDADRDTAAAQLGRQPRAVAGVAYRCPCGKPAVLATMPRLPDGAPFPTTYYLTCPRATAACSRAEVDGRMIEMTQRLRTDPQLATAYRAAHRAYLADRARIGAQGLATGESSSATGSDCDVPEIEDISAGGMPDRVKCLHALAAHALAAGPGVNPLGDEVVAEIGRFWQRPCHPASCQR
jgi:hypothetical protein